MNILITGANRGIGLEFCKQYKEQGHRVHALCRQASNELKALGVQLFEGLDVRSAETSQEIISRLGSEKLDLVIQNAGIMRRTSIDDFNTEAIKEQFEVNSIAPIVLTIRLLSVMSEKAKVALVTSRMGSIADNDSGGSYGYRMSKAALNAAGKSLAIDLNPKGIAVGLLHPGYVKTDMTGHSGYIDTKESVEGMRKVIEHLNLENSGSFWHTNGEELPW